MWLALKVFGFLFGALALVALGVPAWFAVAPPEALRQATAYAAKTSNSNVFIARREVDAIARTDLLALNGHKRQTITIIPSRKLVILRMGNTREDVGFSNSGLLRAIVASGF